MAIRLLFLPLGLFVLPGLVGAQASNIHPTIQAEGEPNQALRQPVQDIAQLEAQVQAEPENADARAKLLSFYRQTQQNDKALEQMLWIIGHHPESNAALFTLVLPSNPNGSGSAGYQQLKSAWEEAIAEHPRNPEVLYHAGLFLQSSDGEKALQLLQQARQEQPSNLRYVQAVARMYEVAALTDTPTISGFALTKDVKARLNAELTGSTNAVLLGHVGSYLALIKAHNPDHPDRQLGLFLLERAIALEPDNPQWKHLLETAKNPPPIVPLISGAVRVSNAVAESNLMKKVDPVYPEMAKAARISGQVQWTAVIGTTGQIQSLQLVSGHPLLVSAAREAVLQYQYKPTLVNGNPVPVSTNILVSFVLPSQ